MTQTILAWHFVGNTLRDGRPVPPDGEWLVHDGPIKPFASGLNASERIIDALTYAPGPTICRVELRGNIVRHNNDKIVGRERRILWRLDDERLLRDFARRCALDVIHLWQAPDIVREYLKTGDEAIRVAAKAAAWDVARAASWFASSAAGLRAAWSAADDAADDAADAAALAAADAAADADVFDAAWDDARDVARAASWDAARDAQNACLTQMVEAAHAKAKEMKQK